MRRQDIAWGVLSLGLLGGVLFIIAGVVLFIHGHNLVDLRSVASQTGDQSIMEVYYNEIGACNMGYGVASVGAGFAVIVASIGVGANLMKK